MQDQTIKNFSSFRTDQKAEDFVDNIDLSKYEFSEFKTVKYEFEPKNTTINLRLPEKLLEAIKEKAKQLGLPYTRFIRLIIEKSL